MKAAHQPQEQGAPIPSQVQTPGESVASSEPSAGSGKETDSAPKPSTRDGAASQPKKRKQREKSASAKRKRAPNSALSREFVSESSDGGGGNVESR